MRNLSPKQRRTATICGACAAIIPSTSLLMQRSHSPGADFAGGLVIGVTLVLSMATLISSRRA